MPASMIDTVDKIRDLVETIENAGDPFLYVDLEGFNLSRDGTIAILQILVAPSPQVYLVDVYQLQRDAFETPGSGGQTLKSIFKSGTIPKVFFDVRRDSDALFAHYGVDLNCVIDVQLLEYATRDWRGDYLNGLARCIKEDARLTRSETERCTDVKEAGRSLFAPEEDGSYEVFLERPLSTRLIRYCVQDVQILPKLLAVYGIRLRNHAEGLELALQVQAEAIGRVKLSQSPDFVGNGHHMKMGPSLAKTLSPAEGALVLPMSAVMSPDLSALCLLNAPADWADENNVPKRVEWWEYHGLPAPTYCKWGGINNWPD